MTSAYLGLILVAFAQAPSSARLDVIVVQGAGGTPEYQEQFDQWTATWRRVADRGKSQLTVIGSGAGSEPQSISDRDRLAAAIEFQLSEAERPLWVVLIGHGTDDRRTAKFNLRGPDISDEWLVKQLAECKRPLAVLCCFSSSAPFMNKLSGPRRVIMTATRSGAERNYSRFGGYLASALAGEAESADLDKDEQASLLEAFLLASKRTQQFYLDDNRLSSEHALLDDNGDQRGTPADWFHGIRPVKSPKDGALDGLLASQMVLVPSERESVASPEFIAARDKLESQISDLRTERGKLTEGEYYRRLETLMVPLAKLYAELQRQP